MLTGTCISSPCGNFYCEGLMLILVDSWWWILDGLNSSHQDTNESIFTHDHNLGLCRKNWLNHGINLYLESRACGGINSPIYINIFIHQYKKCTVVRCLWDTNSWQRHVPSYFGDDYFCKSGHSEGIVFDLLPKSSLGWLVHCVCASARGISMECVHGVCMHMGRGEWERYSLLKQCSVTNYIAHK